MTPESISKHVGLAKKAAADFIRKRPDARHLADDLYAVAVLALFEHAPKWDSRYCALSTYLYPRVQNSLRIYWLCQGGPLKYHSSERVHPAVGVSVSLPKVAAHVEEITSSQVRRPDDLCERQELADLAADRFAQLDPLKAEVFRRYFLEGETIAGVSKTTGLPERTVYRYVAQAREFIAEAA